MKRLEREHGRILSVETKFRGDALAEDALAGATTITVADAGDFDEDGGWLTINGQVVEYIEADDDEGVITLATGLAAAADQGDAVHLYSTFYNEVVDYQEILVELDGEYDNPETVVAELAEGISDLPEGDRGSAGESCTLLRVSDDEWEVAGVGGRPKSSAGMHAEANDVYTITAADVTASTATMTLSHTPIDESVKGFWGALPQEPTEYTVSGSTVTWPLGGVALEGDRLWVHYWYRVAGSSPAVAESSYFDEVMADGPIIYYRFGDEAGATTALDSSGNSHHGAVNGSVTFGAAGMVGDADTAATFGTGYVMADYRTPATGAFTLEAVIRPTDNAQIEEPIWAAHDSVGAVFDFSLYLDRLRFRVWNSGWVTLTGGTVLVAGSDYHVAATYDGVTMRLYVDGVSDGSLASGQGGATSKQLSVGAFADDYPVGTDRTFLGDIDEAAYWEIALSAERIAAHAVARGDA